MKNTGNPIFHFSHGWTVGLILFISFWSCKNHQNETIDWLNQIPRGMIIDEVKRTQPSYVTIDWQRPAIKGNETTYDITYIQGNYDALGMSYSLIFESDQYVGYSAIK
ncbi:MAG: hypothetical protein IPN29_20445 [Saprospiraceae bacterium]|nr:hypothetical protein [Saprospiraceae bacterium]